ncbi:hypothetical protein Asi03nite_73330 [Actinoplanes siamensis]|uniref:Uncharacterized protein n=1 Tax=Actinoplanes siamensis TaxID=1223317 RepID=A0A919NFY2_9ACTN|nr:hypothetical protein Asi03nite_73330 [Actinoplanes siamensis]
MNTGTLGRGSLLAALCPGEQVRNNVRKRFRAWTSPAWSGFSRTSVRSLQTCPALLRAGHRVHTMTTAGGHGELEFGRSDITEFVRQFLSEVLGQRPDNTGLPREVAESQR